MNPRTLWACQPVVFISSARLAPLVRLINSRTFAPLLSGRRVAASLVRAALGAFLGLASFGAAALAFFAAFGPLGAAVFWLAPLSSRGPSPARRARPVPQRRRLVRWWRFLR